MRIGLTGGGTGGHFYPLIAIAEEIRKSASEKDISLYYFADDYFDKKSLEENQIYFIHISAGKARLYSSIANFFDKFKIIWGIVQAMYKLAIIYPDVIFSKGGYVAFPVLFAARILRIPIVIHDSDTVPGRTSVYSAPFAKVICVAWPECSQWLSTKANIPENKIIYTGLPVRSEINPQNPRTSYEYSEFNKFDSRMPIILFIGGSQGSEKINDCLIKSLPLLLNKFQIIHQAGENNFDRVKKLTDELLRTNPEQKSYIVVKNLNVSELRNVYSMANLVVSRGGSQILEFFNFGLPSIVIPIETSNGDHQRTNAYASMRLGANLVIEERNLTPRILDNEITRILNDKSELAEMKLNSKANAKPDSAKMIADIVIHIAQDK